LGKWKLEKSENFDEYMKAVGVNMLTRKVASTLKPNYSITAEENDMYNLRTESTFKNTDMKFKFGEEFDETTSDGRKCKSVVTLDGNKLIHNQVGEVGSVINRELIDDDTLVCTCKAANGVTSTRTYTRIKS